MRTLRTIRNCTVRIETPCPKRWEELESTTDGAVRRCMVCMADVYFCVSPEETLEHARANHCIARDEPDSSERATVVVGRPSIVEADPAKERASALVRRERGIDRVLAGRFDASSRHCPTCGYPVPGFRQSCWVCGHSMGRQPP